MVRVARLKAMVFEGDNSSDPDGLTPAEALTAISARVHELAAEQHLCFLNTIMPRLSAEEIHLVRPEEMSGEQERFLEEYFLRKLYPIVTPLAIDPGPSVSLSGQSLALFRGVLAADSRFASAAYRSFDRPYPDPGGAALYRAAGARRTTCLHAAWKIRLRHYLPRLYHGFEIRSCHAIRVTRDADFLVSRRRDEDLMMTIEKGVRERRMGDAVRLQYDPDIPVETVTQLVEELELTP